MSNKTDGVCYLELNDDSSLTEAIGHHNQSNWRIKGVKLLYTGVDTTIITKFLEQYPQIDTLILRIDSDVSVIPTCLFKITKNIVYFEYHGQAKDFDINSFKFATRLTTLKYFYDTPLEYSIDKQSEKLSDSKKIFKEKNDKSYIHLKKLLEGIINAQNLREVYLWNFQTSILPTEFYALKQIKYIDLSNTYIKNINCDSLARLNNLQILSIRVTDTSEILGCLLNDKRIKIVK